jgi:hypothetical protein
MHLKINRLQHIGVPITDIEISQACFLRGGFYNVLCSVLFNKFKKGKVSMMKLGSIIIELYQMPEPELDKIRQRTSGRIDHIAFDVDDIDETFRLLKDEGFSIPETEPVFLNFWEKGCKYFYILGPDGERLEFCQIL